MPSGHGKAVKRGPFVNIILLGLPGAGKGTQAVRLKEEYGFRHISTGDLIRAEISSGSDFGKQLEDVIRTGNLVSDYLVINILMKAIESETKSIVFDGFPRTVPQAQSLDKYLAQKGKKIDSIVLIDLTEEEVLKRLTSRRVCKKCGAVYNIYSGDFKDQCVKDGGELIIRSDDTLESAKRRLEVFKKETEPLLSYYGKTIGLEKVDGSGTVDEVFAQTVKALKIEK
jgi:adenylate kinase